MWYPTHTSTPIHHHPDASGSHTEAHVPHPKKSSITQMLTSWLFIAILSATLAACKSANDEKIPDPTTGSIQIVTSGLPTDAKPSGAILGPKGYNKLISGNEAITGLDPGSYEVMMYLAEAGGKKYLTGKSQQITIEKGSVKKVEFPYEIEKYHFSIRVSGPEAETRAEQSVITGGFDQDSSYTGTYPSTLSWKQVVNGVVTASGSTTVDAQHQWSLSPVLMKGDNTFTFWVTNDPETEATKNITYSPGLRFDGQFELSPDALWIGESITATGRIAISDENLDPTSVRLVRYNTGSATPIVVATMRDTGDTANDSDEIADDGIFSGKFTTTEATKGSATFRVLAKNKQGMEVVSEGIDTEIDDSDAFLASLNHELQFMKPYDNRSEQAFKAGGNSALKAEILKIWTELQQNTNIISAQIDESGEQVLITFPSGRTNSIGLPEDILTPTDTSQSIMMQSVPQIGIMESMPDYTATHRMHEYRGYFASPTQQAQKVTVSNRKTIAIIPYNYDRINGALHMMNALTDNWTKTKYTTASYGNGSVKHFKNLDQYGMVFISTHGGPVNKKHILCSNELATEEKKKLYKDDLSGKNPRLSIGKAWNTFYIHPSFITTYCKGMANTFVYIGACNKGSSDSMAKAFHDAGAAAVVKFDNISRADAQTTHGKTLLTNWLSSDSLSSAFSITPKTHTLVHDGKNLTSNAVLTWRAGDKPVSDLSLKLPVIQDGSFEDWNMMSAWTREGDVRKLANKFPGNYRPTDGAHCAIITTGFGTGDSKYATMGKMSQIISLGSESFLSFDWNFFSEEFMEYVGSQYQDYFAVTMEEIGNPSNNTILAKASIDSLAYPKGTVTLVPGLHFDHPSGDVFATGWKSMKIAIPEKLKGRKVALRFEVSDIGDSAYDSAVLLDNISIKWGNSLA